MALDTIPKQEGGKLKAVASGTLPNGKPVVVNADGTVSVVDGETVTYEGGTPVVFESGSTAQTSAVYDANAQKVVIVYADEANADYGTAVVGTVSGTSISFGTPVLVNGNRRLIFPSAVYDTNAQKIVIAYRDAGNSNYGTGIVGTVSGTSISFGTAVVFNSGESNYNSAVYDANAQKIVIAYQDAGNSSHGTAIVGTVSGTSISFGSEVVFKSASTLYSSIAYDTNAQKVVIVYGYAPNYHGTAIVGTVSGTSISFGTEVVFNAADSASLAITYEAAAQKVVIAYRNSNNPNPSVAIVGTVSGTSISFGTPVVFDTAWSNSYISIVFDSNSNVVVISYRDNDNSQYGTSIVGMVSGTSISFGDAEVFSGNNTANYIASTYDANAQRVVAAYQDAGNSGYGTAAVFRPGYSSTNLTAENYIGMSTGGAVADGDNATVDIVGTVNKEQSGLTAGQQYYVQTDGTVGTTPANPSVLAGTAVSATKMVVKS